VFADIMTAMEWLLSNASSNSGNQNQESIATLESMGFTSRQAEKALLTCDGNVERAVEWLFNNPDNAGEEHERSSSDEFESGNDYELVGFISHMGANTACGHYVCHLKKVNILLSKSLSNLIQPGELCSI
jgi:ubiquitin carboxyl-terminal hydrolase 5/13